MGKVFKIPGHRLSLGDFFSFPHDPKLKKMRKRLFDLMYYQFSLERGDEVSRLDELRIKSDQALEEIRLAAINYHVPFLQALARAAEESVKHSNFFNDPEQWEFTQIVVWEYLQFFWENGRTEPTKQQLRERVVLRGVNISKRRFTEILKKVELDDLEAGKAGKPLPERKPKMLEIKKNRKPFPRAESGAVEKFKNQGNGSESGTKL